MADVALLLPGWGTSPSRFDRVRAHLREIDVATVDHLVQPDALLETLARRVRQRATELAGDGHRVHLVGHSLGGLVAAWAATDDLTPPLASVVTINTPWRGTWLAWTGTGPLAAQLRYRSPAVACLRKRVGGHLLEPDGPRWLVAATMFDLGTPPTTAMRPGSAAPRLRRRLLPATGHSTSLLHTVTARTVASHVLQAAATRPLTPSPDRSPMG